MIIKIKTKKFFETFFLLILIIYSRTQRLENGEMTKLP